LRFVLGLVKTISSYLFKDYASSCKFAQSLLKYSQAENSWQTSVQYAFYYSLACLALYPTAGDRLQREYLERVAANQQKMKIWAYHAPMNFQHKYDLVDAEKARVLDQALLAMELYDRAISGAREQGYIQEEALAYELAAEFYLALGREEIAASYMKKSHYCYGCWGATAKVKDLESRYRQLLSPWKGMPKSEGTIASTSLTTSGSGEALDLATVMKASQAISSAIVLNKLLANLMKILIENAGAQVGYLILPTEDALLIEASGAVDAEKVTVLQSIAIDNCQEISRRIVNYVARTRETVVLNDATREGFFTNDPYIKDRQPKSVICAPLIDRGKLSGIVYLENNLTTGAFTSSRLEMLNLLSAQAAISIENARSYRKQSQLYRELVELNAAYERFVPSQFLQFLQKKSIVEVQLGDQVQQEMSILFSDIRDFTTLSESMTPSENFQFINSYLSRMEPAIIENNGFIDKYIGDAIMALFGGSADDAVKAGIAMLQELTEYNQHRANSGYLPIKIGIGINTGTIMLGTVGGYSRMDGTVISDAVNLASRVESLTKNYGVSLLITHQTFQRLQDSNQYAIRLIDRAKVKGKSKEVTVYEVFDADPRPVREGKLVTRTAFERAWLLYHRGICGEAAQLFADCLRQNPSDKVAKIYLERCQLPGS